MNEKRPSKKQRELLSFIDGFIKGNGYGPSYREIMRALDYRSVSTVAVHVDGLIVRGLLRKKDNSARSLEIVSEGEVSVVNPVADTHEAWLQKEITARVQKLEAKENEVLRHELAVLSEAVTILGLGASADSEV
jgi:repressor LexA